MADTTVYGYSSPVIYHDGQGNQFEALIYSTRPDLVADGEPAVTLFYLDPAKKPNGPQRGNILDAVLIAYDVPYLATEELYTKGYNETLYTYPVAAVEDPLVKLASIETEMAALKTQLSATATTADTTVTATTIPEATTTAATTGATTAAATTASVSPSTATVASVG